MKKISLLLCVVSSTLLFNSCGSDDNTGSTRTRIPTLIERQDGRERETFEYDSANKLSKFTSELNNARIEYTFLYEGEDVRRVIITSVENGSTQDVVLSDVSYGTDNSVVLAGFNMTFQLNSNNDVTSITTNDGVTNFSYTNGNISSVTENGETYQYRYYSYKGILSGINAPKWVFTLLSSQFKTQTQHAVSGIITTDYLTNFVYDEASFTDGYPTKVNFNTNDPNVGITSGTYTITYR